MKHRNTPFGYGLQDGQIVVNPDEAKVVALVFERYGQGESLQEIAERLQAEGVPYCDGQSRWNINNVSRILRNEKYLGSDGYPRLVEPETFHRIQGFYREKAGKWATPVNDPSRVLWSKLVCRECGGKIARIGGKLARRGIVQLRCGNRNCGNGLDIPDKELLQRICESMHNPVYSPVDTDLILTVQEYEPSAEVFRIRNAVNRLIENPTDPAEARRIILQGIAARYDCLPEEPDQPFDASPICKTQDGGSPYGIDWKLFGKAVSHIAIDKDHQIYVYYKKGKITSNRS